MGKHAKTLLRILRGTSDANTEFSDLCGLLLHLGFSERIKGSHHIFSRSDIPEVINLQALGSKAKAYQVKQVRGILLKYRLGDTNGNDS